MAYQQQPQQGYAQQPYPQQQPSPYQQVQQYQPPQDQQQLQQQPQQQHYQQYQQQQQPQQYHQQQQPMQQQQPQQQQVQHHQHQHQQYAQGQNVNQQDWQNSLFDCGPAESCLLGCCVPCVLLGRTSERMRDPSMATYEPFNTDCMLMCGIMYFTGCGWILAMMKRTEIRERYGIQGDGTADCCTTYWCPCCALIQQDKEVEKRAAAGPVVQAYQSNKEGMQMQMPAQAPQYPSQ